MRGMLKDLLGGLKGLAVLGGVLNDLTTPAGGLWRFRFCISNLFGWFKTFGVAGTDLAASKLRSNMEAAPFLASWDLNPCVRVALGGVCVTVTLKILVPLVFGSTV